jgi:hypothetical protein
MAALIHLSVPFDAVVVHDIPGRLRVVASALKNDPASAALLRAWLDQLTHVHAVQFNALIGSVTIEYARCDGARETVLDLLGNAGCRLEQKAAAPARATAPGNSTWVKAVLHYALDLAVENAILAIL